MVMLLLIRTVPAHQMAQGGFVVHSIKCGTTQIIQEGTLLIKYENNCHAEVFIMQRRGLG